MQNIKIDMTGKRFGKLVVLHEDSSSPKNNLCWICRCDCGRLCSKRGTHLRQGKSTHCGCESPYEIVRYRKPLLKEETVRKYGCAWCLDRTECEKSYKNRSDFKCKYAEVLDKYENYEKYDRAATADFFTVVAAFPPEKEME